MNRTDKSVSLTDQFFYAIKSMNQIYSALRETNNSEKIAALKSLRNEFAAFADQTECNLSVKGLSAKKRESAMQQTAAQRVQELQIKQVNLSQKLDRLLAA